MSHCLLDCDGTMVLTLYERLDLYDSTMVHVQDGRWLIMETWRTDYIDDGLGTFYRTDDNWQYRPYSPYDAYEHSSPGSGIDPEGDRRIIRVYRLLEWNGKDIVPVEPGNTRIVKTTYARYLRRLGLPVPHRYTHPTLKNDPGLTVPVKQPRGHRTDN